MDLHIDVLSFACYLLALVAVIKANSSNVTDVKFYVKFTPLHVKFRTLHGM